MSKIFTCPYKIGLWCPYNGKCGGCENNKKVGTGIKHYDVEYEEEEEDGYMVMRHVLFGE